MGTIWIPGAERITPSLPGGTISASVAGALPKAPPRVVWHTVEAPEDDPAMWQRMIDVLRGKKAEPQVLYHPKSDRLGQFIPLDLAGRALKNDGSVKTNRTGVVCIQIEVIGYAAHPFTDDWTPGPNFRALMAAIRSWGIPDVFPMGAPPKFPGGSVRDRSIWLTEAGHYCHANVPGNDHGDPGAISPQKLFAAAPASAQNNQEDEVTPEQMAAILGRIDAKATEVKNFTEARLKAYALWQESRSKAYANFIVKNRQQTTEKDLDAVLADLDGVQSQGQQILAKLAELDGPQVAKLLAAPDAGDAVHQLLATPAVAEASKEPAA